MSVESNYQNRRPMRACCNIFIQPLHPLSPGRQINPYALSISPSRWRRLLATCDRSNRVVILHPHRQTTCLRPLQRRRSSLRRATLFDEVRTEQVWGAQGKDRGGALFRYGSLERQRHLLRPMHCQRNGFQSHHHLAQAAVIISISVAYKGCLHIPRHSSRNVCCWR